MAKRKSNQEFVSELLEKRPFIIPQEEYKGATVKIKVMSTKCGHSWYASPNNLLSGYGCPYCAGNKRKTNEEFVSELNEKSPKIIPLDEYVNTSTKIRAKCTICGNVWNVRPSDLLSGTGCPSCAKKKRATDENSITSLPILMQEWDYKKNENEDPDYVSRGSHKKVWWICSKCGFSWQTTVKSRVNGNGCPACSGHTLWPGYNDLETVNPELAYEWNYEKNEGLIPSNVYYNSKKSVWWKGTCGHEWEMRINERNSRGYGCPYCSGRRVLPGFNDLATTNPLLAFEWNIEKNRDLSPTSVTAGSGKNAWWVCSICGHEWQAEISSRNKGRGCPRCATAYGTSFPEQAIFYYIKKYFDDAENGNRDLGIELDIYIPSIKTAIEYDGYTWHVDKIEKDNEKDRLCTDAGIELIRVREKGLGKTITAFNIIRKDNYSVTDLEQSINVIIDKLGVRDCFVDINKDRNAIITTYVTNIRNNNLASMKPELVKEWNYEKNGTLKPNMVQYGAHMKVWWKCSVCGHEWEGSVKHRCEGHGCPKCGNIEKSIKNKRTKLYGGKRSLATVNPILAAEWHPEKNSKITPENIAANSKERVWWLGKCGHEWEAPVHGRNIGQGCPYCAGKRILKGFNDLATINPLLAAEWHPNKNGQMLPDSFTAKSSKKAWWKCSVCGYEWETSINNRSNGHGCPQCAKNKRSTSIKRARLKNGSNSLAIVNPTLSLEWDMKKNGDITPEDVTANSKEKVWWFGKCGHEWEASIASRHKGSGCPYCSGNKVLKGYNDLTSINPALAREWNYNKNESITPDEVTARSNKKVWWECSVCGYEWEESIYNRSRGYICPRCKKEKSIY